MKIKEQKGITLVALVITIILMLILTAVILSFTIGENGLFNTAKYAVKKWQNAEQQELADLNELNDYINNENFNINNSELISKDIGDFNPIIKVCNGDYIIVTVPEITVSNNNSVVGYAFLLNGEVVEFTKEKEYMFKDLKLDTSYNISIIAMDKNGNIKYSNIVKQQTSNRLYLYNSKNEYEEITNGWIGQSIYGYGTSYGQYLKTDEYLYVKNTSTDSADVSNYWPSWVTQKQLDLSKYRKLVIEGEFSAPSNTAVDLLVITNSSNMSIGSAYWNYIYNSNNVVDKIELDLTKDVDLRNLYHIAISCQNSNYNNHSEAKIEKVYLEK